MKKKILLILLILVVIYVYKINNQYFLIPDSAIRLRVIPNSNEPRDIYMKEKIKEYLEKNVYDLVKDNQDIDVARKIISENISTIDNNVNSIFKANEYPLKYHISFGNNYFPAKSYKGVKYDEGYYESLVIAIGEAEGDNWWCVLFPNYCLIDKEKHSYNSLIKELFNKYSKNKKEE